MRKFTLKVRIEEALKHPSGEFKILCRTSLDFNDNVIFPFENIMQSFRSLYPTKNLVFTFTII